jgi:hypothetical protein
MGSEPQGDAGDGSSSGGRHGGRRRSNGGGASQCRKEWRPRTGDKNGKLNSDKQREPVDSLWFGDRPARQSMTQWRKRLPWCGDPQHACQSLAPLCGSVVH